jgi:hypothetical protein
MHNSIIGVINKKLISTNNFEHTNWVSIRYVSTENGTIPTLRLFCTGPRLGNFSGSKMNNRMLSTEYPSRLRGHDLHLLKTALRRIDQVATGAEHLRLKLVPVCEAISGVRSAIARTRYSDPDKAAQILSAAAEDLEEQVSSLVILLGRDIGDLLNSHQLTKTSSRRIEQPTLLAAGDALAEDSAHAVPQIASHALSSRQNAKQGTGDLRQAWELEEQITKGCQWLQTLHHAGATTVKCEAKVAPQTSEALLATA